MFQYPKVLTKFSMALLPITRRVNCPGAPGEARRLIFFPDAPLAARDRFPEERVTSAVFFVVEQSALA